MEGGGRITTSLVQILSYSLGNPGSANQWDNYIFLCAVFLTSGDLGFPRGKLQENEEENWAERTGVKNISL